MAQFIMQYWLEFLFAGIGGAIVLLGKKFWSMYKKENKDGLDQAIQDSINQFNQDLQKTLQQLADENQKQNTQISSVCDGVLNLQGISFKSYCRMLLREDYAITLEEFENCQQEYEVYKSLGGNGQGKMLYDLVCEKASKSLSDTKKSGT